MKVRIQAVVRWSLAVALTLTASCADTLVSPPQVVSGADAAHDRERGRGRFGLMLRTTRLARSVETSGWIYPNVAEAQSLSIGSAGLTLVFPPGAVSEPLHVTIVANAGRLITYEFLPHGVTFNVPVEVRQELRETTAWRNNALTSNFVGGYLARGLADIDAVTGTGALSELFPVVYRHGTGPTAAGAPVATFQTSHFSGYTLASGIVPPKPLGR